MASYNLKIALIGKQRAYLKTLCSLVFASCILLPVQSAFAAPIPLPKTKPTWISNVGVSGTTAAKRTASSIPTFREAEINPIEEAAPQSAKTVATASKPVFDDGTVMMTASPTTLPTTPKRKPKPPVDLSAHIPWVMPSKSYKATQEKVGRPGSMLCNLTFDDGPHKLYDPIILDALKKHNAKATFYLVGRNVARYPELVKRMVDEGHEIANHSWKHDNLRKLSASAVTRDLKRTNDQIEKTIGRAPRMFRPPYGSHNEGVLRAAKRLNMETLLWTVDSLDWKKISPETVRKRVVNRSGPGAVILMHSIQKRTAKALPQILAGLRKKGCVFVTSEDWVKAVAN